ncbi:3'-5' exonuclease [Streptomonospora sp. S1-112]|uniref:3'-5' exonuclease n=1 Tax=Streptomonospora mangrovi TaxID=2883123 RepID=A0A9X3NKB5_9ACTN|nr:3'-5' exonuclease [Streptomonospora mangrovi]MDA0564878.1 3'-5' exonuclease [Streptomonospora mangrovi]
MTEPPWTDAPLTALDLEGTGAQDRDNEAILEIAVVPLAGGLPAVNDAYETLVNPGRPVPRRPWISPGLTDAVLREAPEPEAVAPELLRRLNGRFIVGHNVGVDWRLLHLRFPEVRPAGIIDTLKLAKLTGAPKRSLTALTDAYRLTDRVNELVPGGRPHRALWDAVAAALLLAELVAEHWLRTPSLNELVAGAGEGWGAEGDGGYEQTSLL